MKIAGLAALAAVLMVAGPVSAHDIGWQAGSPRIKGVGHCAKGACQRRAAFDATVPHAHVSDSKCSGQGAGGYRFDAKFDCRRR